MKKIISAVVVTLAFFVSGCASITTSKSQLINVTTSNNEPAEVTIDDKTITAPGMILVLRDGNDKVAQTKTEGCDNVTFVKKSVTPLFFGNIIFGGFLGSTTDVATGKMWDYEDSVEISCAE